MEKCNGTVLWRCEPIGGSPAIVKLKALMKCWTPKPAVQVNNSTSSCIATMVSRPPIPSPKGTTKVSFFFCLLLGFFIFTSDWKLDLYACLPQLLSTVTLLKHEEMIGDWQTSWGKAHYGPCQIPGVSICSSQPSVLRWQECVGGLTILKKLAELQFPDELE